MNTFKYIVQIFYNFSTSKFLMNYANPRLKVSVGNINAILGHLQTATPPLPL